MDTFILSIDQGTTGTTALLINRKSFKISAKVNIEYPQIYPIPGWVEHNLHDIWDSVEQAVKKVIQKANIQNTQINEIGITNQRETTCAFTKKGIPLHNAIVWQDRRTSEMCDRLRNDYKHFSNKTGLPLDPYFSATKMNWLLNNSNPVKEAAENDDLCLSTIDSYLLFRLTGSKQFKTEASNASRTLLMNLSTGKWDDDLLNFFKIDKSYLPSIEDSFSPFGLTSGLNFLPDGIPITCILGDQQAALFGQLGFQAGSLKCTYGTGAFLLLNTGPEIIHSQSGLLTTVAYKHQNKLIYALEGSTYIAGAAVGWLRDNLKIIQQSSDVENLASQVKDLSQLKHLLFMPFFTGIGSPYWRADAKGAILGLTRDTQNSHLARAALDGIALSVNDSIKSLINDATTNPNIKIQEIRVDGGAAANDLLMQIQANFSQISITRPEVIETTGYGVALGCLITSGEYTFNDLKDLWKKDKDFHPILDSYYSEKSKMWTKMINVLF